MAEAPEGPATHQHSAPPWGRCVSLERWRRGKGKGRGGEGRGGEGRHQDRIIFEQHRPVLRRQSAVKGLPRPRRRLPTAARDRQTGGPVARLGAGCADAGGGNTGGGLRSQLRRQHAPRGAPLDGATWMGDRFPGDEEEAADGGARGAEGPAAPLPHAAPPPAHRRAGSSDRRRAGRRHRRGATRTLLLPWKR